MTRKTTELVEGEQHEFCSVRQLRTLLAREASAKFRARWCPALDPAERTLAEFVVERYSLYCERGMAMRALGRLLGQSVQLWRGDIEHEPWPVQPARLELLESTMLEASGLGSARMQPYAAHFSSGVRSIDFFLDTQCARI